MNKNYFFFLILFFLILLNDLFFGEIFELTDGTIIDGTIKKYEENEYLILDNKTGKTRKVNKTQIKKMMKNDEYEKEQEQKEIIKKQLEDLKKRLEDFEKRTESENKKNKKEENSYKGSYLLNYFYKNPYFGIINFSSKKKGKLYVINIDAVMLYIEENSDVNLDLKLVRKNIIESIKNPKTNLNLYNALLSISDLNINPPEESILPIGEYIAWFENGYNTFYEVFTLYENDIKNVYINNALTKTIKIDSNPGNASLYVNNKYIGTTPVNITVENDEVYELEFRRKFCKNSFAKLETKDFSSLLSSYTYNLILDRKKKLVSIKTVPEGTKLYINDYYIGTTPLTTELYEDTYYKLKFEKTGYHTLSTSITTDELKYINDIYSYTLEEKDEDVREVSITSLPIGADVYIDGYYKGKTPCKAYIAGPKVIGIKLYMKSYYNSEKSVHLKNKGNYIYHFDLEPDPNFCMEKYESGQWGVTYWMPIPTTNQPFSNIFKFGLGTSYLVNFGYFIPVRGYYAMDFIWAYSDRKIWNDLPDYIKSGFIFMNNYTLGMSFTIPAWRSPIIIGLGFLKLGYMIEYVEASSKINNIKTNFGVFFGFGSEGFLGIQLLATESFGFYLYYKIGLLVSFNHLYYKQSFFNMDGQTISLGIKF